MDVIDEARQGNWVIGPKLYVEQSNTEDISMELIVAMTGKTFLGETQIVETCKETERHFR